MGFLSSWTGWFWTDGDGHFAYLDTEKQFDICYELIQRPKRRHPPIQIFPKEVRMIMRDTAFSIMEEMKDALCEIQFEELEMARQALVNAKNLLFGSQKIKDDSKYFLHETTPLGFTAYMLETYIAR